MIRAIKQILEAFFWLTLSKILPAENLPLLWKLGRMVGGLSYRMSPARRKLIEMEMQLVFPKKSKAEIDQMVKNSFIDFCIAQIEELHFPVMNKENIDKMITLDGKKILDQALAKKKGVIAIHPHFGSYLLIIPALGYNDYKVNQVAARGNPPKKMLEKNPGFETKDGIRWVVYNHRLKNENNLPGDFIDMKSLRKIYEKAANNEIIAISGTGRGGQGFVPVQLCGRQALLANGPYRMSAKTGSVLLPMFTVRDKDSKHRLAIEQPIEIKDSSPEEVSRAAQQFADHLTNYINKYPEQFGMRLWRMRRNAHWDDHPFFIDYAHDDAWKKYCSEPDK